MKTFDRRVLKIFLIGLPFVFLVSLYAHSIEPATLLVSSTLDSLNTFSGIAFAFWMTFALYLSLRLIFSNNFRSEILPRLSFFKERDERELLMTANATRNSFLTTLAILTLFLCLSLFQVAIYRLPPEQALNGKTGTISLGLKFDLVATDHTATALDYFRYNGLPLTNAAMIIILILWQLGSFNYFMRRLSKTELS